MSDSTLYTVKEIRVLISKTHDEVAKGMAVSRQLYGKLENGKRSWTLSNSNKWLRYVLGELDKLPNGLVDFSRVLDFCDLNVLNESVDTNWQ